MIKILIADDEGIVIESLKFIIKKNFGSNCVMESAKTGREVLEEMDRFQPDIVFMDIQMPGINGIEAMKEIRQTNKQVKFIVMTAYDKFAYAKEAVNLQVVEYLTKPVNHSVIVDVLTKTITQIEKDRAKRSNELEIKEKLETVVPIIESGLIYSAIFDEDSFREVENYLRLLGIDNEYGMMMVLEFGDSRIDKAHSQELTNPTGANVRAHSFYPALREICKEFFSCVVGPVMTNHVIIFIPSMEKKLDYDERIQLIEKSRNLVKKVSVHIEMSFRIGIGTVTAVTRLCDSYKEAILALKLAKGKVTHANDLDLGCSYEESYPIELEKELFQVIEHGNVVMANMKATSFFEWMVSNYSGCITDIQLKVLEFALWAEKIAYESGGMTYYFQSRSNYLAEIMSMQDERKLKQWFLHKIVTACQNVATKKQEKQTSIIGMAQEYIDTYYEKDISLDNVSKHLNISPYYFSKLFKDKTGENFIEYLTRVRIESAKQLIRDSNASMKEICSRSGFQDPNYFSRIFKRYVGLTPTEFKERG